MTGPLTWLMLEQWQRVLVVSPHPDDETIGAGGLLARLARQESFTSVLTMTCAEDRHVELKTACERLDVTAVRYGLQPDGLLDTVPQRQLIAHIETSVDEFDPQVIIGPWWGSYHQDHRAVGHALISALRPMSPNRSVLFYEQTADGWCTQPFRPDLWVRLTEADVDAKLDAYQEHCSQVRPSPSNRSVEAIRALATTRGAQIGASYAEAFMCGRIVL
ncbi:MAG: PIG-L deacetylase family protein [Actinomycetota bacterium]